MKRELGLMMNTTKRKVGAAVLCGALMASIGIGTAYAANSMSSLQVKSMNGVTTYSTDEGKTWSEKAPEGVSSSEKDGKLTISNGQPPKDGEAKGTLSKVEDNVRTYSTDGGKTWSENAPEGAEEGVTIGE
ncbi:sialidase family protein [Neobacillus jeddahensis]|uniref:sialidase family protein n=1 Tax=Neobacillus jeddahensis TaxID=1461580 RepID=UPI00058D7B06|nr:sialidase family protein [Neobacillus jeddahensis]